MPSSSLGPSRFVDHQNRTGAILSMMEAPSEVSSALEEGEILPTELEARKRVLSSNFLAAIRENPDDERLDRSFADALFFRKLPTGETAEQVIFKISSDVLDGGEMAFAIAASPIRLTPLGEAANSSRFSPESVRQIIRAMRVLQASTSFEDVCSELLHMLGALPEQQNADWTKAASTSSTRFVVKPADLAFVISMWRSGHTIAQMFGELPAVKRSKAKDNVNEWLSGSRVSENWAASFDKFADFVESVIEGYLPWLLEACASLSAVLSAIGPYIPWGAFVSIVKETVDQRHAAAELVGQEETP
jgi:helicase